MASYTPTERAYYDRFFSVIDKDQSGVLPGHDALPFLVSSGLPQQVLGEVWAVADPDNNGFLTKDSWYKAARLIGHMQKGGAQVDESLAIKAGPYPTFVGQQPPAQPISTQVTGSLPPLTAADRAKFTKIFVGCGPHNGLVSGDKARDVFLKSQLNYDKLGQIWMLADTKQRGSLDLPDFIVGMYLIQSCMANTALTLPTTLPLTVYEQASGGRSPTSPIRQTAGPASPIRPQHTGQMQPQYTGMQLQYTGQMKPQYTGQVKPQHSCQNTQSSAWDITSDAKATSDHFFTQLDPQNKGVIEGDVAVPFMLQSQLDETALASIWDLADIRKEGKLTKGEFAVAMHLINGKLAGREVPSVLPDSLIPPALRNEFGQQEVLTEPSSTAKDLFDLFSDDPPPSAAAPSFTPSAFLPSPPSRKSTAPPPPASHALSPVATGASNTFSSAGFASRMVPNPAPPGDLLGDDSAPTTVPDRSAEIGNKQNQLAATECSNSELEKQRADLEKSAASIFAQLEELEQRLSSARVKHEAETKSVDDLRVRVNDQQTTIKTLNTDLISAESDLSAMRSEKDELEQALLRDKEEVRGLQRRMKEVEDEKTGLKPMLEKMKKEARQQKGMVTIAKKQLTTAEGSRDSLQSEIKAEESAEMFSPFTAAAVPLPATPQALSPAPTGVSQRSNNPFDRLRNARSPTRTTPTESDQGLGTSALLGAGAVVGAAAGVVAAGASTLYDAAKEVVSPDASEQQKDLAPSPPVDTPESEDPFGANTDEVQHESVPQDNDISHEASEVDPFGAPTSPQADQGFSTGFGDSFAASTVPTVIEFESEFNAQPKAKTDFDSDFDSFDTPATANPKSQVSEPASRSLDFDPPSLEHAQHSPNPSTGPAPDDSFDPSRNDPAPAPDFDSTFTTFDQQQSDCIPSGIPKSAIPYLRPEAERTASTQAVAAESAPDSPAVNDDASSDEDEGPEDLDQPKLWANPTGGSQRAQISPQQIAEEAKTRRSAPPPPSAKTSLAPPIDDFNPFGVPAPSAQPQLPPGAAPSQAQGNAFDEDDFDFSYQPSVKVDDSHMAPVTFRNDFDFDDEFEKPSAGQGSEGSNGMSKSYEMVSPPAQNDAWGAQAAPPSQPSVFSFDDAFGGDFEPAPAAQPAAFQPPPGAPASRETLSAPPLPQRRDSEAQADDIEDVKKLCGMGFGRSLVVEALAASSYDFQKTLNVLLQ